MVKHPGPTPKKGITPVALTPGKKGAKPSDDAENDTLASLMARRSVVSRQRAIGGEGIAEWGDGDQFTSGQDIQGLRAQAEMVRQDRTIFSFVANYDKNRFTSVPLFDQTRVELLPSPKLEEDEDDMDKRIMAIPSKLIKEEQLKGRADQKRKWVEDIKHRVQRERARGRPEENTYIHASLIVPLENKVLLAPAVLTQAPMPNTTIDFWRMVYQLGARVIVCITSDKEGKKGKEKPENYPYWPAVPNTQLSFSTPIISFDVRCLSSTVHGGCVRETSLELTMNGRRKRTLSHFHCPIWPDTQTARPNVEATRRLYATVGQAQAVQQDNTPLVICCRSGTEQSSTFLLIYWLARQMVCERPVSIPHTALNIRRQRFGSLDSLQTLNDAYRAVFHILRRNGNLTTDKKERSARFNKALQQLGLLVLHH